MTADWHPIMTAREVEPGHWYLIDTLGDPYGEIRFVRRGGEVGYRADRCDGTGVAERQVGYFRSLRAAAWNIHVDFIRSHGAPTRKSYSS
ncbi:hypothetical protein B0I08_11133 [Glaciihabitans tibetensis]|uniref:Uncharacterized protein n=1 Tax=Glaciihabitans tibetensis TaxID=1266600 RepID=A0A2T0V4A5_9MICO|nr:hypothetical protein [Glaciihabitans tibetensis]PRY65016.1 hypothetical protein B0I08_11133 [Glaciihabitans tibetensis]